MQQRGAHEKRRAPRHPVAFKFKGVEVSLLGTAGGPRRPIWGKIQDISAGGLSLLSDRPVEEFHLVRGEVLLPRARVGIPTLLYVRWRQQSRTRSRYRMGLQFVF
jgi:hypothetical protein